MSQQKVFRLNLSNLSFNRGLWKILFDVQSYYYCYFFFFLHLTNRIPQANVDLMCYRLQELILPGNEFRSVPPEIFRLKNIKRLSLARNGIKTLPAEMGMLTTLTELDLSHNSLTELPPQVRFLLL